MEHDRASSFAVRQIRIIIHELLVVRKVRRASNVWPFSINLRSRRSLEWREDTRVLFLSRAQLELNFTPSSCYTG